MVDGEQKPQSLWKIKGARALRRDKGQERGPTSLLSGWAGPSGELWASEGVLARPGGVVSKAAQRTGRREDSVWLCLCPPSEGHPGCRLRVCKCQ